MEINYVSIVSAVIAVICAGLLAFTLTPPTRVLAFKIGAIDIPKDDRRMHSTPKPRIGGLAIYVAFTVVTVIFCQRTDEMISIWFGGLLLVVLGILDDVYRLPALVKFIFQLVAALIAVSQGVVISQINFFGHFVAFGIFEIPITLLWIVGLTNAINLIDGLDGLACGVSAICSACLMTVALIVGEFSSALMIAILMGSCLGFLPFNSNPSRIFMGDTGALFLGYTMAVLSVQGVFKLSTVISFLIPVSIFAFPIFDTMFAFGRRIAHGKSPFAADKGHLHHKLIDMGFTHKQSVYILYSVCGILGISAIVFTEAMSREYRYSKAIITVAVAIGVFVLNFIILKNKKTRIQSGLVAATEEEEKELLKEILEKDRSIKKHSKESPQVPAPEPPADISPQGKDHGK
jgi:UDP-GlcNAc:undecaprenyl-phosphate GlcNAc-1-phosphate transferase